MSTHSKNITEALLAPMNLIQLAENCSQNLSEKALIQSLIACLGVYCDERGWKYTSYFLEKAQESLCNSEAE